MKKVKKDEIKNNFQFKIISSNKKNIIKRTWTKLRWRRD
jgi:hypothetical protein